MPEKVLFKSESDFDRATIADYLRSVADKLESGDSLTLSSGDQSVTLNPPGRVTFEVKAEREWSRGRKSSGELSVEFELEWREGAEGQGSGGELTIE